MIVITNLIFNSIIILRYQSIHYSSIQKLIRQHLSIISMISISGNQKLQENCLFQQLYQLADVSIQKHKTNSKNNQVHSATDLPVENKSQQDLYQAQHGNRPKVNKQQYQPSQITKFILSKIQHQKNQPWKLLNNIPQIIDEFISKSQQNSKLYKKPGEPEAATHFKIEGEPYFKLSESIYIGSGTTIQHGAFICGPCIIGNNCQIRKGGYVRGNVILGDGTLIGNSCEVKNALLMDHCQIAHFSYVGDSILGVKAHLSAGTITSNYKLDGSQIKVSVNKGNSDDHKQQKEGKNQEPVDSVKKNGQKKTKVQTLLSGRNKLGALLGHNVEVGCNAILNPGTIIGKNSVIYPMVSWRGYLGKNKICKIGQTHQIVERKLNA